CTAPARNPPSYDAGVRPTGAAGGGSRPGWLGVIAAAGLALLLGLAPRPASAHATILSSTPRAGETLRTAPGVVVLTFSQRLDIRPSRATVTAPGGRRVGQSTVSASEIRVARAATAPGTYQVP